MKEKEKKLSVNNVCMLMKFNSNTKAYLEHKYAGKEYSEKEWKIKFKKDRLNF